MKRNLFLPNRHQDEYVGLHELEEMLVTLVRFYQGSCYLPRLIFCVYPLGGGCMADRAVAAAFERMRYLGYTTRDHAVA